MACLSKITVMLYKQSPPQTKIYRNNYKKKIQIKIHCRKSDYNKLEENGLSIILRNSLPKIALDNNKTVKKLQQLLSTAKVLSQTANWYI